MFVFVFLILLPLQLFSRVLTALSHLYRCFARKPFFAFSGGRLVSSTTGLMLGFKNSKSCLFPDLLVRVLATKEHVCREQTGNIKKTLKEVRGTYHKLLIRLFFSCAQLNLLKKGHKNRLQHLHGSTVGTLMKVTTQLMLIDQAAPTGTFIWTKGTTALFTPPERLNQSVLYQS